MLELLLCVSGWVLEIWDLVMGEIIKVRMWCLENG